jgi:antitoxin YefM
VFSFGNQTVVNCCEKRSAQKQMAKDFHEQYFCAVPGCGQVLHQTSVEIQLIGQYPVQHMKSITYTEARENLANTINRVCEDNAPVIITRRRDQAVVVLSLAEYESLQETAHLLRSPANAKRLLKSIESLERGRGVRKRLNLDA